MKVGRPIRVDDSTSLVSKGRFARICSEVDITKPLLSKFTMEGKAWPIEYKGIHLICFGCGIYGHRKEQCGSRRAGEDTREKNMTEDGRNPATKEDQETMPPLMTKQTPKGPDLSEKYGSWMIATRKARRGPMNPNTQGLENSPRRNNGGNGPRGKVNVLGKEV